MARFQMDYIPAVGRRLGLGIPDLKNGFFIDWEEQKEKALRLSPEAQSYLRDFLSVQCYGHILFSSYFSVIKTLTFLSNTGEYSIE